MVCGDLWWFAEICGGLWWFAMEYGDLSYSPTASVARGFFWGTHNVRDDLQLSHFVG